MKGNIEVLLIDIGNTLIKAAEVADGAIGQTKTWASLQSLLQSYSSDIPKIACSTGSQTLERSSGHVLTYQTPLPIKLNYKTPDTLGTDRIAAAVGAFDLFPGVNSLVIDMGTCITMDFVSEDGVFTGGIISPGLSMRLKAMSQMTSNLPDLSEKWESINLKLLGSSTNECMLAGAFGGIINEIDGLLRQLEKDFTSINVILTGGDAPHFESKVKGHIFAGSKIVLTGLYRIWKGLEGR